MSFPFISFHCVNFQTKLRDWGQLIIFNEEFCVAMTEKLSGTSDRNVNRPKVYLRWQLRGWSDIWELFYTMTSLHVSTSRLCGQASHRFPRPQLWGCLTLDAPQIFADHVCGTTEGFRICGVIHRKIVHFCTFRSLCCVVWCQVTFKVEDFCCY